MQIGPWLPLFSHEVGQLPVPCAPFAVVGHAPCSPGALLAPRSPGSGAQTAAVGRCRPASEFPVVASEQETCDVRGMRFASCKGQHCCSQPARRPGGSAAPGTAFRGRRWSPVC